MGRGSDGWTRQRRRRPCASGRSLTTIRAIRERVDQVDRARKKAHAAGGLEALDDLHHWLCSALDALNQGLAPDPGDAA